MNFIVKYKWQLLFVLIFGTFLHFTFELSHDNFIVALFSAINESVWEHLKLLFVPMLIISLFEKLIYRNRNAFGNLISTIFGMTFIIVTFYTYSGILGNNFMVMDIMIFIFAVLLTFFIKNNLIRTEPYDNYGMIGLLIIALLFICFTIFPPHIPFFLDPIARTYGL